jgi:hypothetical protein
MTAQTITCVVLSCDGCGDPIAFDADGVQAHTAATGGDVEAATAEARRWLAACGGAADGERDWCDRCVFAAECAPEAVVAGA